MPSAAFSLLTVSRDVDWDSMPYLRVKNNGPGIPIPPKYGSFLQDMYREDIARLHGRFCDMIAGWRC